MKLPMLTADDKLAEIKRLYYRTTAKTIQADLARALDLLKSMNNEDERERAAVYMDGLAQMRQDWKRDAARRTKNVERLPTFYVLFSIVFLRAAMRSGSGTLRSMAICAQSFELTRCSRFMLSATGVLGFFTRPSTTL